MSLCASRSLASSPKPLSVGSLLVVAATSLAFATPAAAQGTAPKKEAPSKPGEKKAAPKATPAATPSTPTSAAPTTQTEDVKPTEPAATTEDTEKEKARAIYISLDLGFSRADVGGLSDSTGFDKTGANGILAGVGVGYRYGNFRFGGRFRDTSTTEFSLWSLMGEIGYGLPIRPISPALYVHAGYMFDVGVERGAIASSLPRTNVLTPDVDLNGVVVGGEIVASYWFTSFLRLGPFIGFDATILSRSQADLPQSLLPIDAETRAKPLFSDSGSGLGYMLNIGIRGTGDIAF